MKLLTGLSAYSRANGRLAKVRLKNMFFEASPTSPSGVVVIPRPGLVELLDVACRSVYREDGVYGGDLFTVRGSVLMRAEEDLGDIAGTGRVEWAYTVDGLFILSGGIVYQYDGEDLVATDFPDDALVVSITQMDSILLGVRADTGTMYFRLPGDDTWNPLDFFSAERRPDPVLAVRAMSDRVYAFGSATVEQFTPTGNTGTPFQRIGGVVINRGVYDRDSIVLLDNTLFFVGEDGVAYRLTDGAPVRISDHGIEEQIRLSGTAKAMSCTWEGHPFYVLQLDAETLVYDVAGGWANWWHGEAPFPANGLFDGETIYVAGGKLWTLADVSDDDGTPMERLFTAVLPAEAPVTVDCIEVQLSPGTTPIDSEPATLQMRWSDDQGRTFTDWKNASTGFGGEFRKRVRFRRGGMADQPGRLYEIRMTDPVHIRFSGCELNPALGGRSRV